MSQWTTANADHLGMQCPDKSPLPDGDNLMGLGQAMDQAEVQAGMHNSMLMHKDMSIACQAPVEAFPLLHQETLQGTKVHGVHPTGNLQTGTHMVQTEGVISGVHLHILRIYPKEACLAMMMTRTTTCQAACLDHLWICPQVSIHTVSPKS